MSQPAMKLCTGAHGCGEMLWVEEFRTFTTGQRSTYCRDCERRFDRERRGSRIVEESVGLQVPRYEDDDGFDALINERQTEYWNQAATAAKLTLPEFIVQAIDMAAGDVLDRAATIKTTA